MLNLIFNKLVVEQFNATTQLGEFVWANLTSDNFNELLAITEEEQDRLLAGREVYLLNDDDLVAYSELGDIRVELEAAKLKHAVKADFMTWLLEEKGLVALRKLALRI